MAALFRFHHLRLSAFRLSRSSFFPLVRSPTLQKFQTKVLSTSIDAGEIQEKHVELPRDLQYTRSDVHLRKIYIGNLFSKQATKEERQISKHALFKYFSKFGEVELIELPRKFPRNQLAGPVQGFGFVTFRDVKVSQKLLADEESHEIDGQNITVAPLRNQKMAIREKRNLTVLVKNILNSTSKQAIEEHFSRFGKVDKVFLAQKDTTDENLSSFYVMFSSLSGVQNALQEPMQRIAEQSIDSQVIEFPQTKEIIGKTKKLVLSSVPDELTVEDLKDYFQEFGDVELVELLVNLPLLFSVEGNRNVAYVRLASEATVEEITQKDFHSINGLDVKVSKHRNPTVDVPDKLRHLKLSVEGVPLSNGVPFIRQYLKKTFDIVPIGVFFDKRQILGNNKTPCFVRFSDQREVEMVLKEPKVTFEGTVLHIRRLVWKKLKH